MNKEELNRSKLSKQLVEDINLKAPISAEMLNGVILVLLIAYITEKDGIKTVAKQETMMRDYLYDVVYPNVDAELRQSADILAKSDIPPSTVSLILKKHLKKSEIAEIVNDIADYYYPLVIAGNVTTPPSINRLCLALLNPVHGSFYDGTAGVGGTCVAAGLHSGDLEIFAQEKIPALCAILNIRAYINGITKITVRDGDVLTEPRFAEKIFDYSVMLPPMGSSEWLFVMHQIDSLKEKTGRGVIAVSTGTLFNSAFAKYRRYMTENGYIECVITLPSKILPFTPAPISLMVVGKAKRENAAVLMIQAEELFDKNYDVRITNQLNEDVIDKIVSLYNGGNCNENAAKRVEYGRFAQGDCILLPSRYITASETDSEFGKLSVNFDETEKWIKLGELSEIYRGINVSQAAKKRNDGKYGIINYADVQNGEIDIEALKRFDINVNPKGYTVQPGDVIVSCKGVVIKTCIIPDNVDNVLLSINFIGIRLNKDICDPKYLKCYLDSPAGQTYLKNRQVGTSIITLKNSDLAEMAIPPLSPEAQKKYISDYEKAHKKIHDEIEQLYRRLTDEKWQLYKKIGIADVILKKQEEKNYESND